MIITVLLANNYTGTGGRKVKKKRRSSNDGDHTPAAPPANTGVFSITRQRAQWSTEEDNVVS